MIDHDRKLKEFMGRKDQERTEAHEQMEAMKKKKGQSHTSNCKIISCLHMYRQIHLLSSVCITHVQGPGFNPQLGPDFSGFLYSLRKLSSLEEFTM